MDRLKQNQTDDMFTFTDEEMRNASVETILLRMLSTKSAISVNSSLTESNQQVFTSAGKGQCGTVYALRGTDMVIKVPNTAAGKDDELFQDFQMHKRISKAFSSSASIRQDMHVHVPHLQAWIDPKSAHFWETKTALFPQEAAIPNYGLISSRIHPVPFPVRSAIVDALCPQAVQNSKIAFLNKPENKDCLIRLYLGRRNDTRKTCARNIRLRNFPLHVDEMQRLGLDTHMFTRILAQALALLHWRAHVDANDVEFVLGNAPHISGTPAEQDVLSATKDTAPLLYVTDFEHRKVALWLLDFNQCNTFTHDDAGLRKLVEGFWFNDPYYPRPSAVEDGDRELWRVFEERYLHVGTQIATTWREGPRLFIDKVVEEGRSRVGGLFG
jgi:hypothetical protein